MAGCFRNAPGTMGRRLLLLLLGPDQVKSTEGPDHTTRSDQIMGGAVSPDHGSMEPPVPQSPSASAASSRACAVIMLVGL